MESVMEKLWKTQISIDSEIPSYEFLFQWEAVNEGILEVVEVCGIANYCMKKRTIFDP